MSIAVRERKALGLKERGSAAAGRPIKPRRAVALASSAGGLNALTQVLSALPAATPLATTRYEQRAEDAEKHAKVLRGILQQGGAEMEEVG